MGRLQRQNKILEIIKKFPISTQQELVDKLKEEGYNLTQATVSRDINEMGLIKKSFGKDKIKYVLMETRAEKSFSEKHAELFMECVVSIISSLNLIVVKTMAGSANSVAAFLDELNLDGLLGSVAGDDTIIAVAQSVEEAAKIATELNRIKNSKGK